MYKFTFSSYTVIHLTWRTVIEIPVMYRFDFTTVHHYYTERLFDELSVTERVDTLIGD